MLWAHSTMSDCEFDRIADRLDVTDDLTERADLAGELVRSVSRYEDTLARALFPRMDGLDNEELQMQRDQLRGAMRLIHERTTGIDPRNVHASDGQRFEDTLSDAVATLRRLLAGEDRHIVSRSRVSILMDAENLPMRSPAHFGALRNGPILPIPPSAGSSAICGSNWTTHSRMWLLPLTLDLTPSMAEQYSGAS